MLYIFWLLHQTTTRNQTEPYHLKLYIFWLLHQTTTLSRSSAGNIGCISFDSYIKPQHNETLTICCRVVYLLTPTSNHNLMVFFSNEILLYIFWLLHQTTTSFGLCSYRYCCISFDSYIKPQHWSWLKLWWIVVYLLTPTSNHNLNLLITLKSRLYIFWLLHQTTTIASSKPWQICCISFDSYIKPQLERATIERFLSCISFDSYIKPQQSHYLGYSQSVVYLLTPTSNHNATFICLATNKLYIFWLLHQTTT